jgi:uncharacterized protein (TIGR02646 family)
MRHIERPTLSADFEAYLVARQAEVDAGADVQNAWEAAARSRPFRPVRETLRRMAGERERCMYCEDSHGMDVEHFWPKKGDARKGHPGYPERCFIWANLLLACAECNRAKGTRFPLDEQGEPLLLDPTADWPTEHLTFIPETCQFAAAFDERGEESRRGVTTLEVLPTLNIEPVRRGRRRTYNAIRKAVEGLLAGVMSGGELLSTLKENGEYGLAQWFFLGKGSEDEPFATLSREHPYLWVQAQAVARNAS